MINFIITCGTSQIERKKLEAVGLSDSEVDRLITDLEKCRPVAMLDQEFEHPLNLIVDSLLRKEQLLQITIGTDDNPFGAEFSTLYMIMDPDHAGGRRIFSILSSETGKGVFCARILQSLLIRRYEIDPGDINILKVPGLKEDPQDQDEIESLMHNLLDKISDSLVNNSGRMADNVIVMTGGFKSVIPCLTLVATLFGLEMVYLFEHSRHIQKLMPMINLKEKNIRQKWINNWNDVMRSGQVNEMSWMYQLIKIRNERKDEVFWS